MKGKQRKDSQYDQYEQIFYDVKPFHEGTFGLKLNKGIFGEGKKQSFYRKTCGRMININELAHQDLIDKGRFGGHETFTPRYGWLKKGFDAFKEDPNIFKREDAIERLGVGKNMVRSIKHWCRAFKILVPDPEGNEIISHLADKLLSNYGWDPYLEDIGSLWLLHYQLFLPRLESLGHVVAFNSSSLERFDIKQMASYMYTTSRMYSRFKAVTQESFQREASCLIRMYAEGTAEPELECPFTQLRLLIPGDRPHAYAFNVGEKSTLPPVILLACCMLYMKHYMEPNVSTISIQRLATGFNSPGVAFKISETSLGNALEQALSSTSGLAIEYAAGSPQLHVVDNNLDLELLVTNILGNYYEKE